MPDMFDELFGPHDRWDAERDDDFGDDTDFEDDWPYEEDDSEQLD